MTLTHIIAAGAVGVLLVAEALAPFFVEQRKDLGRLARHDLRNLLVGGFNALCLAPVFATALLVVEYKLTLRGFGLLPRLDLPTGWSLALALLLFDCWMYWWHRLNHAVPLLWRFHRMHHSDPAMDVSSGVRFHPGEIFLSGVARLLMVPLLGISITQLAIYESILLPVVLFHHSNIRLPRWLDFGLFRAGIVVTPAMHRVHHSQRREETNSNYASVLPVWDQLFGTLRVREDVAAIDYGLPEFSSEQSQTLAGMLKTPLTGSETVDDASRHKPRH